PRNVFPTATSAHRSSSLPWPVTPDFGHDGTPVFLWCSGPISYSQSCNGYTVALSSFSFFYAVLYILCAAVYVIFQSELASCCFISNAMALRSHGGQIRRTETVTPSHFEPNISRRPRDRDHSSFNTRSQLA